MKPGLSIQLYTVRHEAERDFEGTIRRIADMGYRYVEPAGFPGTTPAKAAALFKALGLECLSCHGGLPVGDDANRVIEEAQMLGIRYIITGGPHGGWDAALSDADAIRRTASIYTKAAEFAKRFDIEVGYHNHDREMREIDGVPAYRIFLDETPESVLWQADVYWVAFGGRDAVEFTREIGPRGKILHLKDGVLKTNVQLPVGSGDLDIEAICAAAGHAELLAVELDEFDGDMMTAVAQSYDYIIGHDLARGSE
jgi:sugar phosphate isomerase/epimerase